MDPQTQQQEAPPHSNKKVILFSLVAVGAIFVLIIISVLSISSGEKTSENNTQVLTPTDTQPKSSTDSAKQDGEATPTPLDGWKTYKNSQFSFNYPPAWIVKALSFPNGEIGTSIQPVEISASEPSVLIVGTKSDPNITVQKQKIYIDMGFKKSNLIIDNLQAVRLAGSIKSASSSAGVQANHIYFTKDQTDYLLKYSYASSGVNQVLESLFGKIIESLRVEN